MFEVTDVYIGNYVKITLADGEIVSGILVSMNIDYVLVKKYVDFQFVGYVAILSRHIVSIDSLKKFTLVAHSEGMDAINTGVGSFVEISSWEHLIKEIFLQGLFVIFHDVNDSLHVGRLVNIDRDALQVMCVDYDFQYRQVPVTLKREIVCMVEFGSEYARIYSLYGGKI